MSYNTKELLDSRSPRVKSKLDQKNRSQYQNYQEELSNYRRKNRSQLQEWNLMESKLMIPNSSKQFTPSGGISYKLITGKNERSHGQASNQHQNHYNKADSDCSSQPDQYRQYKNKKGTYSYKIHHDFSVIAYEQKKNQELTEEIKKMRRQLIDLNKEADSKLGKYQIAYIASRTALQPQQPEKQQELVLRKIEVNTKIIDSQVKQIDQIKRRDKQMEENDFLIDLESKTNLIFQDIHQKKKEKYKKRVEVEKLDSKLIERRQRQNAIQMEVEYRMVKVFKHQILYYFKKFQENKVICDQLDERYQDLKRKDQELTKQLNRFSQHANQNNLLVKVNKSYVENKKIQDQLKARLQKQKKNIEVVQFSFLVNQQKANKQIHKMKKEADKLDKKTAQMSQISTQLAQKADSLIQKHKIGEKMVKNMSYRFAETLLKDSQLKVQKSKQQQPQSKTVHIKKKEDHYNLKPKLNLVKKDRSLDLSGQLSSRFRTLDHHDNSRYESQKQKNGSDRNDKNFTIDVQKDKKPPMRPNLRIKRLKGDNSPSRNKSTLNKSDVELQINENQSKLVDLNYKPNRLTKLKLSQSKKKVPAGPLTDDYMKSLQKKGLKNLAQI